MRSHDNIRVINTKSFQARHLVRLITSLLGKLRNYPEYLFTANVLRNINFVLDNKGLMTFSNWIPRRLVSKKACYL